MKHPYLDVLIVGAGLSGIGAACHLKEKCPNVRFGTVSYTHLTLPTNREV